MLSRQDIEECTNLTRYQVLVTKPKHVKSFKYVCHRNNVRLKYNRVKRYTNNLKQYVALEGISTTGLDTWTTFDSLDLTCLTPAQHEFIHEYLRFGNIVQTAKALSWNINTAKSTFRGAILRLRLQLVNS